MALQEIRPMLWTEKINETIDFYTAVLGFTCGAQNDEWGWAALHRDTIEIMIARPNQHMVFEKPTFTGSLYILTDSVESLWAELKDKVDVVYPLEDFEWDMREFAIRDNNGYTLQFGQDLSETD